VANNFDIITMDSLINKLKFLGFTEYESKVFISVLRGRMMSASEIANKAGVRRTDVYDILKTFVDKGYCNEIETNSILKYEMISPDIIFDKIERDILRKKEKELSSLKDTLKDLKPLYRTEESEKNNIVNVELIRGYNQHREEKFIELLKKAKKEIHFMIRPEIYLSDEIDDVADAFYKEGGKIKSIYQSGENYKVKKNDKWVKASKKDFITTLEKFEKAGEQIKISSQAVPTIIIFDAETVFMNISDKSLPRHNEADLVVRNKEFADSMITVFNTFWKTSYNIKEFKKINYKKEL
jgi:sugar-specific transcriptional regulator TrmB